MDWRSCSRRTAHRPPASTCSSRRATACRIYDPVDPMAAVAPEACILLAAVTKPENPSEAKVHAPTLASDAPASGSDPMLERGDTLPAPAGTSAALSELVIVEPTFYADRKILTHGGMGRIVTAR